MTAIKAGTLKARKQVLRSFIQNHYTDRKLAEVLAFAQDGKLRYGSCCCFIGVVTTDKFLAKDSEFLAVELDHPVIHYSRAKRLSGAYVAEDAYAYLGAPTESFTSSSVLADHRDELRLRILIPILKAEIKRRDFLKQAFAPLPSITATDSEQSMEQSMEQLDQVPVSV